MSGRAVRLSLTAVVALAGAACAGPFTQMRAASRDEVRAEQLRQRERAARSALINRERLARLALPLLRAAAPLCGRNVGVVAQAKTSADGFASPAAAMCAFTVSVEPDGAIDAHADDRSIVVTSAMLHFMNDDELSVVLAHEIAHGVMRHASAAPITFSQDFESEADYVGLYILAWAGRPIDDAAQLWRRLAGEHPAEITFANSHPTTAERFVRLEQWRSEINRKIASGMDFGPDVKDQRFAVVNRMAAPSELSAPTSVALTEPPESHSTAMVRTQSLGAPRNVVREEPRPPSRGGASSSTTVLELPTGNDTYARATIGAPLSEADRAAAVPAYEQGTAFLGSHRWGQAKVKLREALRFDGSVAAYHAALAEVLEIEQDWAGAAAEYTAALLLDVDNMTYRVRLKEARLQF
ncbi:MAG TPA: M48 family metalloprotease [Gemmatimonadaceae bacterium]|nr:M48 family metalloprotease [Gemmatimonadaceae bacterium]